MNFPNLVDTGKNISSLYFANEDCEGKGSFKNFANIAIFWKLFAEAIKAVDISTSVLCSPLFKRGCELHLFAMCPFSQA